MRPFPTQFALSRKAGTAAAATAPVPTATNKQSQQLSAPQHEPAAPAAKRVEAPEAVGVSAENEQALAAMGAAGVADAVRSCVEELACMCM